MLQNKLANILQGWKEGLTGYIAQMSSDHAYIHKGFSQTAIINTGSISSAYYIGFTTPSVASGKFVHWRPINASSSANYVQAELYEGDSFTGGTAVTMIDRNRVSDNETNMQAFNQGVTSTPAGLLVQLTGIGIEGNAATRSGGGSRAAEELVLKQNTSYVLKLTPAGATTVLMSLFWYEEDGYQG